MMTTVVVDVIHDGMESAFRVVRSPRISPSQRLINLGDITGPLIRVGQWNARGIHVSQRRHTTGI